MSSEIVKCHLGDKSTLTWGPLYQTLQKVEKVFYSLLYPQLGM